MLYDLIKMSTCEKRQKETLLRGEKVTVTYFCDQAAIRLLNAAVVVFFLPSVFHVPCGSVSVSSSSSFPAADEHKHEFLLLHYNTVCVDTSSPPESHHCE